MERAKTGDAAGPDSAAYGALHTYEVRTLNEGDTQRIGRPRANSRRALERVARQRDQLEAALHLLSRAILIAEGDGRVVFANNAAQGLLDRRDGLELRSGRLAATNRGGQGAFIAALKSVAQGETSSASIALRRARSRPAAIVFALASSPRTGVNGTRQIVLMVDVDQTPPLGQLGSAFQLTPAEIRLWEALSEGRSLAGIAARNGVSVNTLRVQLASIYRKTGAHRQADLVRMALSFEALPAGFGQ